MHCDEPPHPSWTGVMNSASLSSANTARLPSYRSTYLRYHPYPMTSRPHHDDYLMNTVDYRTSSGGLETITEEPEAVRLKPTTVTACEERQDPDVSSLELDFPVVDDQLVHEYEQAQLARAAAERKGKFANLVLAVRRKVLALLAVAEYLGAQEMK